MAEEPKTRSISLHLGDVDVMLSDNDPDLELRALRLIDELLAKMHKEVKFSMDPDCEEEEIELTSEELKEKDKAKKLKLRANKHLLQSAYV